MNLRALAVALVIAAVLSTLGIVFYAHAPARPGTAAEVTLPFSHGSTFTLLRTIRMIIGNKSYVVEETEEVFSVVEPGFPLTLAKTLDGSTRYVPTVFLAVPEELLGSEFYAPISAKLMNESVCVHLKPSGARHAGGTPGTCRSVLVEVSYDRSGLVQYALLYSGVGEVVYSEKVYVVARSVSGEARVRTSHVCASLYSRDIAFAMPGLYRFDRSGVHYVADRDYGKYRPLLLVLKAPENQRMWESLPERYRGYVLLVSPLLADLNRVPELDRLLREKVLYLE